MCNIKNTECCMQTIANTEKNTQERGYTRTRIHKNEDTQGVQKAGEYIICNGVYLTH